MGMASFWCRADAPWLLLLAILSAGQLAPGSGTTEGFLTLKKVTSETLGVTYQAFDVRLCHEHAWERCHMYGMTLAMPKTQAEHDFLRNNVLGTNHSATWIGLTDVWTKDVWQWMDKETVSFDDFISGHCPAWNEDCIQVQPVGWSAAKCANTLPFVCQKPVSYTCTNTSDYHMNDKCYSLVIGGGDFHAAQTNCSSSGGTLPMPKTEEELKYLLDIAYSDVGFWMGTTDLRLWLDGSDVTYSINNIQCPNTDNEQMLQTYGSGFAYIRGSDCLAMEVTPLAADSIICEFQLNTVHCGSPSLQNGVFIDVINVTVGALANFTCNTGYGVVGEAGAQCVQNGTWQLLGHCQVVDCGEPQEIDGGDVMLDLNRTTYMSSMTYTCDAGYTLIGQATSTCLSSARWSNKPACLDNDCDCACTSVNYTESLEEKLEYIVTDLTLNKAALSSTRRKLTSADDTRPSSMYIGIAGVFVFVLPFGLLVFFDVSAVTARSCKK